METILRKIHSPADSSLPLVKLLVLSRLLHFNLVYMFHNYFSINYKDSVAVQSLFLELTSTSAVL